ncbi:MAG: DUF4112 domain-containing protein [Candidatus Saccharibacteria bacterium]|nr:DUF4112 domain-containing protein [Candidatus Saccharibacteria bacterium]
MKKHFKRATFLANLLDNKFEILGLKFGIDPILGLIPGGGDLISFILSLYIVWIGIKVELPQNKILRMIRNTLLDFGIGLIPVLGDIADFTFKSNLTNLEILKQHMGREIIEGEVVV